jgi:hypothetical protein
MNQKENCDELIKTLKETQKKDKHILKETKALNLILLNLQIENARIKENTGITPIANNLREIIQKIEKEILISIKEKEIIIKDFSE